MPELCEIVLTAQYLHDKIINRNITNVNIVKGKYTRESFEGYDLLKNQTNKIIDINTKGKFMWFILMDDKKEFVYMMVWFGLTGGFNVLNHANIDANTDTNLRIEFNLDNQYKLYFYDQRNFGRIVVTKDKKKLDSKLKELAPDYLKQNRSTNDLFNDYKEFLNKYPKKNDMLIVVFLQNQKTNESIGSGIGNYLSVEILYRAKISPYRKINSLSDKEIKLLCRMIRDIVKLCYVNNKTGYMKEFGDFIELHRNGVKNGSYPNYLPDIDVDSLKPFEFMVYRKDKDPEGNEVKADKIIDGKTTYWVPSVQK